MFKTLHLEGRLRYETFKVVCIDIYLRRQYTTNPNTYLSQCLFSLINGNYSCLPISINYPNLSLSEIDFLSEVDEGMDQYKARRKALDLDD